MALAEAVTKALEKQGITVQTHKDAQGIAVQTRVDAEKPVYSGKRSDGTQIVLKAAMPHQDPNEQDIRRALLENEFNIQNAIGSHPNICQAYKLFKIEIEGQTHYILAVNFVDGKPLDARQKELHQNPDGDRLYFRALRGAADAVRYLHKRGIAHLDIKPKNIIVDNVSQKGILIDFGSAKKEGQEYPGVLKGFALCTLDFAPCEQLWGEPSRKSDVYQLGATILDGISWSGTFYDTTRDEKGSVTEVHYNSPADLFDENPGLKKYKTLRNMLERARSNNPDARPSIEDMYAMIRDHEIYFRKHPIHSRLLPYSTNPETSRTARTETLI